MPGTAVYEKLKEILAPILGDIMAESAIWVRCKKLGIDHTVLSGADLPRLAPEIQSSVTVFIGSEKAKAVAERILAIR